MEKISPTSLLRDLHVFEKDFWLGYKTLEKLLPPERFNEIKLSILKSKRFDKYLKEVDIQQYETEKALLDAEWTLKNEEAKQAGISIHEKIRNLFCTNNVKDFGIDTSVYRVSALENFLTTEKGIFNELRIEYQLDPEVTLVGIIDCVIKNGNHLTIIDFKTNDKITTSSHYDVAKKKKKTLKWPMSKYLDTDITQYLILISIYAWILQQINPDFIIDSLEIWLMKDLKIKNKYPVEYIKKDIDVLMKWAVKNTKIKKEMLKCNLLVF